MPAIQVQASITTGGSNSNLFAGSAFEFARSRQLVSLGVTADGTGGLITINSGSDVILEESPCYVSTTFPIVPDQMFYNDVMELGDRLRVAARNPSGSTLIFRAIALITPVA
jgi:hypothetical protein